MADEEGSIGGWKGGWMVGVTCFTERTGARPCGEIRLRQQLLKGLDRQDGGAVGGALGSDTGRR